MAITTWLCGYNFRVLELIQCLSLGTCTTLVGISMTLTTHYSRVQSLTKLNRIGCEDKGLNTKSNGNISALGYKTNCSAWLNAFGYLHEGSCTSWEHNLYNGRGVQIGVTESNLGNYSWTFIIMLWISKAVPARSSGEGFTKFPTC